MSTATTPGYESSEEQLRDELARVEHLVRAQTARWRATIADAKPEHLWGMVHVTDAEVDAYLRHGPGTPGAVPPELKDAMAPHWEDAREVGRRIDERRAATTGVELRLERLARVYALTPPQRDLLLLCLLPELDGRYRRLYGYLQDDASREHPTVELLLEMLRPVLDVRDGRSVLAAASGLRRGHLVQLVGGPDGAEGLSRREVRVDDRVVRYLVGDDTPDDRLVGVLEEGPPVDWDDLILDDPQIAGLQELAIWSAERLADGGAVVLAHGPPGSGRRTSARALCAATAIPLLEADTAALRRAHPDWERAVALTYREAALRRAALTWTDVDVLFEHGEPLPEWDVLLGHAEGAGALTFLTGELNWDPAGRFREVPFLRLSLQVPGFDLRRRLWERHLPSAAEWAEPVPDRSAVAELLASGFQLTPGQILDAIATARAVAAVRDPRTRGLVLADLSEGCRRQSGRHLVTLARRVEPRPGLTFEDLVLADPNRRQLDELRDRIRLRSRLLSGYGFERRPPQGQGLLVLFTGSSGTGKTMTAELLAQEQGVDLYKVDLAEVVSKYIGETEKNLRRMFEEAEDANAIVFFDEADALFGRRGEVREARDRWANIEVNFLLQRVEEYTGTVILATNLRQNIDEAFLRRIHVVVEFPFPDADARFRIWHGLLPPGMGHPAADAVRDLAHRFSLTGGSIRNIVVDAAYRALAAGGDPPEVTVRRLVGATARELQKLGKPITGAEFGPDLYAWIEEDIL